jgi:hypothetical protein
MYQSMYQTINLYHTKHQPCTTTCTTTSASTMHQHLYQLCINHAPTPVPNRASTMHLNHLYPTVHQPYQLYHIPCTNHVPYHVSTMYINHHHVPYHVPTIPYHTMCQPCTSTMYIIHTMCQPCTSIYHIMYHIPYTMKCVSTIYHITLNHAMYHKISLMYMPISQICASNNEP